MRNRKVTPEMVVRIQELCELGWKQQDIANEVGVNRMSVSYLLNPEVKMRHALSDLKRQQSKRMKAMAIVGKGIIRCSYPGCNITDWRIIEIGHHNGDARLDYGNSGKRTGKYGDHQSFYRAIVNSKRLTEGLNLVCANHNWLNQYESGRQAFNPASFGARVVKELGGPCVWPDCGITDSRILTKNHKDGGGNKDDKAYGGNGTNLNRSILYGDVPLDLFNVLCHNHQILYEYQEHRRTDYTNMDIDTEVATRLLDEQPSPEFSIALSQIAQLRTRIGG